MYLFDQQLPSLLSGVNLTADANTRIQVFQQAANII